jgi:hypothetical protein
MNNSAQILDDFFTRRRKQTYESDHMDKILPARSTLSR